MQEEGFAVRSVKLLDYHQSSAHVDRIPINLSRSCRTSQWRCFDEGKHPTFPFCYRQVALIIEKSVRNKNPTRNIMHFSARVTCAPPAEIDWCRLCTLVRRSLSNSALYAVLSPQIDRQQLLKGSCFKVKACLCVEFVGLYPTAASGTQTLRRGDEGKQMCGGKYSSCRGTETLTWQMKIFASKTCSARMERVHLRAYLSTPCI